ncbi:MAG: hypothetical protein NVSMB57_09000 [Actinomycetota bacterium]
MRRAIRFLCAGLISITAFFGATQGAVAASCVGACITIAGHVTGPKGEPVSGYTVLVQNATVNTSAVTDASGAYAASVPVTTSDKCYQVAGTSDAYYANSTTGHKTCESTQTMDLNPMVRIQSFSGVQKTYYPDSSKPLILPLDVRALSHSSAAPWASDPMPFGVDFHDPSAVRPDSSHDGFFSGPVVDRIAQDVWRYTWHTTITIPAHQPGYWDVDFGRDGSPFSPMMECRMIWFGFGTDSIAPAQAVAGQTVTLTGQRLGSVPGKVVLKGSGQVTTISGTSIVSWSDTSVSFIVPPLAKTGWAALITPSGVRTNAQYLSIPSATPPTRVGPIIV